MGGGEGEAHPSVGPLTIINLTYQSLYMHISQNGFSMFTEKRKDSHKKCGNTHFYKKKLLLNHMYISHKHTHSLSLSFILSHPISFVYLAITRQCL